MIFSQIYRNNSTLFVCFIIVHLPFAKFLLLATFCLNSYIFVCLTTNYLIYVKQLLLKVYDFLLIINDLY